ncbi:MAG: radical SAM protein [Myxococcales bacterium]|nr:radical SAM protein [Myxococcales bacterium]MDD9968889.1 radical SAM protein [Myxococcales bacterium]
MLRLVEEHHGGSNRRFAVLLADGAMVEAVLYRGDTLCVSTQVGCAVGCPFCASGARGFGRNLSLEELMEQVDAVRRRGARLERVTASGVGEPLHNPALPAFIEACRQQRLPVSVTTSGGPLSRLPDLLRSFHNGVTLSVHAGSEAARARAVPRGPALGPLFQLLYREVPRLSGRRRRRLALAYLLVADVNDGADEIDAFVERVRPLGDLNIHLYDYNPVQTSAHRGVGRRAYEMAYARLTGAGLRVRMSCKARLEPNGGCGTLVALKARRPAGRSRSVLG